MALICEISHAFRCVLNLGRSYVRCVERDGWLHQRKSEFGLNLDNPTVRPGQSAPTNLLFGVRNTFRHGWKVMRWYKIKLTWWTNDYERLKRGVVEVMVSVQN
jgi:hypothetical protein